MTSCIVEGKLESLNFGKREIQDVSDSLKILWYFTCLVYENNWLVINSFVLSVVYAQQHFLNLPIYILFNVLCVHMQVRT